MLRLHQIFLYNFLFIFGITFVLSGTVSYFLLRSIEINQFEEHLKNNIAMLSHETETSHDLDALAKRIKKETNLRLTIISNTGIVLAESHKDRKEMDNHAQREEITKAKENTFGTSIRYSASLHYDFLYVGKKTLLNGEPGYIRLAVSLQQVMEDFYSIWLKITLVFSMMASVGFLIALHMSRRIEEDVTQLTNYLETVAKKSYSEPLSLHSSIEFMKIGNTLKSVVAKLDKREKQRRKTTAKFRLMYKQQNDLLSAISHEIKNPLAAISGYAQTLIEELPIKSHKMHHKFLGKIEQNSLKITAMLDRIALSVKLENNDIIAQKKDFDLGETIQDAIAVMNKKYPNRQINFNYSKEMVHMDETMSEVLVINLIDNAIKYSEDEVDVTLDNKRLYVTDKGIGMSEENCEKVRSKFYRVDSNSWDNSMGLGLAIVSYILKLHDSHLDIKSTLGKGSTFSFKYRT